MDLSGKRIILGLTGGIACYKSAELLRRMQDEGATADVVMTEAATRFITPATMQALSGRPVWVDAWDARMDNRMAHINLTRGADAVLVAPASTDFLARSFAWRWPGLPGLRGLGLAALQAVPPLKRALARQMMFGRR